MDIIGWLYGLGALAGVLIILLFLSYIFWLWMVVDAIQQRDVFWVVLFAISFLTGFLGGVLAGVYYLAVYRPRVKR